MAPSTPTTRLLLKTKPTLVRGWSGTTFTTTWALLPLTFSKGTFSSSSNASRLLRSSTRCSTNTSLFFYARAWWVVLVESAVDWISFLIQNANGKKCVLCIRIILQLFNKKLKLSTTTFPFLDRVFFNLSTSRGSPSFHVSPTLYHLWIKFLPRF